jgi:hypothetical protein
MTSPYDNMQTRDLCGNPLPRPFRWALKAGERVVATAGERRGQIGRLIEPVGVEMSWVRWSEADQTTYPHRSLQKAGSMTPCCIQARPTQEGA